MPRLLQVIIAMGGAFFAWRTYAALYERHRAASEAPDALTEKWWRVLTYAVACFLFSFVLVVAAVAVRLPRWVALFLFALLAASSLLALAGAVALRSRAVRGPL